MKKQGGCSLTENTRFFTKFNLNAMETLELKKDRPIWLLDDIEKSLQNIYSQFLAAKTRNEHLREENQKLKDEQYKDNELSQMKSEYEKMRAEYYRGFPISEEEGRKANEWMNSQREKLPANEGAIGGRFQYIFLPTSIGVVGQVKDTFTEDIFTFREL